MPQPEPDELAKAYAAVHAAHRQRLDAGYTALRAAMSTHFPGATLLVDEDRFGEHPPSVIGVWSGEQLVANEAFWSELADKAAAVSTAFTELVDHARVVGHTPAVKPPAGALADALVPSMRYKIWVLDI